VIRVLRYKQPKPLHGHFTFQIHEGGEVMGYQEFWREEGGWEVVLDVLCDMSKPVERRSFFICAGGDSLDFVGEYASAFHVATHYAKNSYAVYVFDTSHVSDTDLQTAIETNKKIYRGKPDQEEYGGKRKYRERQKVRAHVYGPGKPDIYRFHDSTPECQGIFQVRGELPALCPGCRRPRLEAVSDGGETRAM